MDRKMNTKILDAKFLNDIADEIRNARTKFPSNRHQLAALTEKVGEVANALLERDYAKPLMITGEVKTTYDLDIWKECVQVASMALRLATEGDKSFQYIPPKYEDF